MNKFKVIIVGTLTGLLIALIAKMFDPNTSALIGTASGIGIGLIFSSKY